MLRKIGTWFVGLSKIGKAGVVLASVFVVSAAASPSPSTPTPAPATQPAPQTQSDTTEKKTVTATESIPFKSLTVEDGNLEKGKSTLRTAGINGIKSLTYELTLTNGVQTSKKLVKEEITTPATDEVTAIGTYVAPVQVSSCDSNYTGACVPIASDVDCAGGSGNGPAYVSGPVYVVGYDKYDLDRDNDGVGCE